MVVYICPPPIRKQYIQSISICQQIIRKRGDDSMAAYIPYTEEQKRRANEVDLEEFLRRQGEAHGKTVELFGQGD